MWGPISLYRPKHWVFHSRLNWFGLSKTQNVENTGSRELPKRQSENWWKTETPRKVNSPWYPHGLFWRSLRICRPISSMLGSSEWPLFGPRVFALSGLLLLNDLPTLKKRMVPEAFREKHGRRPGSEKTLPWKCKNPQMVPILPDLDKDFLFSGFWGLCEVIGFIKTCLCHTYLYI